MKPALPIMNDAKSQPMLRKDVGRSSWVAGAVGLISVLAATPSQAAGISGYVIPAQVQVEGGNVYVFGPFQNPDGCASSNMVVLAAANMDELARMMSMAMTAVASGKKISFWFNACKPTPWAASAPQAVSTGFHAG